MSATRPVDRRSALRAVLLLGCAMTAGVPVTACGARPQGQLSEGELTSRFGLGHVRWRLAMPADQPPRGLVVVLHGYGGDADAAFDLGYADALDATRLAVVSVDGGNRYWHRRRDGTDSGAMVREELIPLALDRCGLPAGARVGLLGWSMGGFGALLLASELGRGRVTGVVAASAALWRTAGETPAGAFDDREDFDRHSILERADRLDGIPIRLDCGRSDPFIAANRALAERLSRVESHFEPGGHDDAWWRARATDEMDWLAALA
ncbi:alpha/beta hydrolase-fold protein [Intrasporangium calvum]|uniref:Acyl-CoA:diacylglycerol acyltransferase n=1 Tax=Intrasporangium calvum TaxID=53358 RepID=A0ABT5GGA8_9MICO|nr:alpha/beta hydrolase-fold protein [Intrasporangium calvum]MDC5696865.1 alpha/beta hydrolase-fold protein [Intrasporangium calvum]